MNLYTLALFTHLTGVIVIFAGMGTWLFGMAALRQARSADQVRILVALMITSGNFVVGGVVVLGIAGFYMAITAWGIRASWIVVATVSFALLAPGGIWVLDRRVRAIAKLAGAMPDGPLSSMLNRRVHDPVLGTGSYLYVACLFGIAYLMTNKPATTEAILAMLAAIALGLVASLPFWLGRRGEVEITRSTNRNTR